MLIDVDEVKILFHLFTSLSEMYDPKLNKWTSIPDMKCSRDGACEVAASKRLYVIGGYDGSRYLKSVDCYDSYTNTWSVDGKLKLDPKPK